MSENNDIQQLKIIMEKALQVVNDLPESYKIEAFKIAVSILLKGNFPNVQHNGTDLNTPLLEGNTPEEKVANICRISIEELKNVVSIKGEGIDLVYRIKEKNEKIQQIIGTLVFLLVSEVAFGTEWAKSSSILTVLKKIGVQDKGRNFSTNLKDQTNLFLKKPSEQEYRLTTSHGRAIAIKIIQKFGKLEEVTKEDIK